MPIFDQGYQHWQGTLGNTARRWLAVTRHGIRVGMENRILRLQILASWIPALMLAGVICLWGMVEQKTPWAMSFLSSFRTLRGLVNDPSSFRVTAWTLCFHQFIFVEIYLIMLMVLMVGPSLISQDLRFNALPPYFSRPVRRIDYFAGKLGVIGFFLAAVTIAPAVLAWLLGICFSLDFTAVADTFRLLAGMIAYGIIVTLSAGLLMLALSSLSRNSRYIAIFWACVWFLTLGVSHLLQELNRHQLNAQYVRPLRMQFFQKQNDLRNLEQQRFNQPFNPGQPRPEDQKREQRIEQLRADFAQLQNEINNGQAMVDEARSQDLWQLLDYTGNLQRLGYALIGSREAWEKVDEMMNVTAFPGQGFNAPGPMPFLQNLAKTMVPSYPWYWSALVLLGIAGVSVWILNTRVKSMDRLR